MENEEPNLPSMDNFQSQEGGDGSQGVVVAVIDASKELNPSSLSAADWALNNVARSGDILILLGILHQVNNPSTLSTRPFKMATHLLGYKSKADSVSFNGTSGKIIRDEVAKKQNEIERISGSISSDCSKKGVKFNVQVRTGPIRKVTVDETTALGATCVVLDRHLKKDKKHFAEQLSCGIVQMRRNNGGDIVHQCSRKEQSQEEPSFDSRISSGQLPLLPSSHFIVENTDYNPAELCSIEFGSSSMTEAALPEALNTLGGDNVNTLPANSTESFFSEEQPESEDMGASLPATTEDDNLETVFIDAIPYPGLSTLVEDPLPRSYSTGSDSSHLTKTSFSPSAPSISRACSFPVLTTLNSPIDIPMMKIRKCAQLDSMPSGFGASSAPVDPVMQNNSLSPPPMTQAVKTPSIVRSVSDPCFQTLTSNWSSSIVPNSLAAYVRPISVQPRRTYEAHALRNLLNQEELGSDQYHYNNMQEPTTKQDSEKEVRNIAKEMGDMEMVLEEISIREDSEEDATETTRTVGYSNLTDLAQQQGIPQEECHEEPEQKPTDLQPLHHIHRKKTSHKGNPISRSISLGPSHLCAVCKERSPEFGKPPRKFTYAELEAATGNFSKENFIAEGGFGFVYKGVLKEGQAIAVKQHKLASTQGEREFRSEVELLSCARHRNLVMLLGYCDDKGHRMLVYEYVCNGSLDCHLSVNNPKVIDWAARRKIAVGAARGLRYLHEECRVGCIVHRDMRPNNILLTHEFEPLVGDFGLARSQPSEDMSIETRVIGTFGYLAPEYAESGQVSWKSDVYSFGVVLLELITGRKAVDLSRQPGEQSLTEWARPMLNDRKYHELLDTRLADSNEISEFFSMFRAASLCISKDPSTRPRMSQVLHILEGENKNPDGSPRPSVDSSCSAMMRMLGSLELSSTASQIYSQQDTTQKSQRLSLKGKKPKLSYTEML